MNEPITSLIDIDEGILIRAGDKKWSGCVAGRDGKYIYAIPDGAPRVGKFDIAAKKVTEIGPIVGMGKLELKWSGGVLAADGRIYCTPVYATYYLKMNTTNDEVEEMTDVQLPENHPLGFPLWRNSEALGLGSSL